MLEAVVGFLALALTGAAVARWWIVAVPFVLGAVYVACAAVLGGEDRDGTAAWELASMFGGLIACAAALGLAAGVVWGKWWRYTTGGE